MDVILLERIEKLGQMGDVVTVKPGYARNYLLPRNKALRASDANRASFDEQRTQLEAENLKHKEEADQVANDMAGMTVIIVRQASESDQLYGSVTTRDIASAITEGGVTADRRQIKLNRPIKTVGMHLVRVDLHPEVSVEVVANVARSEEEAEMQARGERINRDGDVVDIEVEAIEVEEVFEEGAAPEVEELTIEDSSTEAEAVAEPSVEDTAPVEDAETEDAAVAEDNPENPQE
jgi:large subunit ribosomal protein L9